jgi:hypothetical protein
LPTMLQRLLDRVLEPERERRIASAAELESELERVATHLGVASTRDIAGLVSAHLVPRIAARRATIEAALVAANQRPSAREASDSLTEVDAPRTDVDDFRAAGPDAPTVSFDGALARPISSVSLRAHAAPNPESVTPPDIAHSVAATEPPARSRHWPALAFATMGVLAAALALALTRTAPAVLPLASSTPPAPKAPLSVAAAPSAPALVSEAPPASPPVVRLEDMPLSPAPTAAAAAKPPRVKKRAPRPKRAVPKKDVWSAFSEQR